MLTLPAIQTAFLELAPQFPIVRAELFGSYAAGRAGEHSDLDVLIEKTPAFSLFDMCRFTMLLEERLGLPVDVVTREAARDMCIGERVTLYER